MASPTTDLPTKSPARSPFPLSAHRSKSLVPAEQSPAEPCHTKAKATLHEATTEVAQGVVQAHRVGVLEKAMDLQQATRREKEVVQVVPELHKASPFQAPCQGPLLAIRAAWCQTSVQDPGPGPFYPPPWST